MSYLKLFTTVQDHAVGFQSVNQAIDNDDALNAAFDLSHSIGINGNSPPGYPTKAIGRHDDILIARTVANFTVDTTLAVPTLSAIVAGPVFGSLYYTRLAAGQWQIFLATPQLFAAVALMTSTASVDRKATCFRVGTIPSIIVSTWVVSTATLTDLPFQLQIWTQLP